MYMNYEFELSQDNLRDSIINDNLKRNSRLNNLMKLINTLKRNTIIAIDGSWGIGKTVFVKQLEMLNKCDFKDSNGNDKNINNIEESTKKEFNNTHRVYYYNAWENDLCDSPLQSLLLFLLNELPSNKDIIVDFGEIKNKLPSHLYKILCGLGSGVINHFNDKAEKVTGINLKETIKATVDLSKDINELSDYNDLADTITTTNKIKDAINDLINDLLKKDSKIVFIIDELDRCRPDYAVRLLETITHFYDNDKLIFLVSCNSQQLSHTISKFYGNNFDSYGYLSKIFNFMITLENINPKEYINDVLKKTFGNEYFDLMALAMFESYEFSMRKIGRYLYYRDTLLEYYTTGIKNDNLLIKYCFLPYLIGLKLIDGEKYNKFLNGEGLDYFIDFYYKNKKCEEVVNGLYKIQEESSPEKVIEDTYTKYFSNIDNDDYCDKKIRQRLLEVLSFISNFSSLS